MTRKQAISAAIQALSEKGGNSEAIRILQEISNALPLMTWTREAITDAVEQFILDNGRIPTATDFRKKGLPPHTEFPRRFGITLKEWLNKNYPAKRQCKKFSLSDDDITFFISEYHRICPTSASDYNAHRSQYAKGWSTIAKGMRLHRWHELLDALDLPLYHRKGSSSPSLKIHMIVDTDTVS